MYNCRARGDVDNQIGVLYDSIRKYITKYNKDYLIDENFVFKTYNNTDFENILICDNAIPIELAKKTRQFAQHILFDNTLDTINDMTNQPKNNVYMILKQNDDVFIENIFKDTFKNTSNDISKNTSNDISKNTSNDISKNTSNDISKNTSNDISKNTSNDISKNTSNDTFAEFTTSDSYDLNIPNQWMWEKYHDEIYRVIPLTLNSFCSSPFIELINILEQKWINTQFYDFDFNKLIKGSWVIQRIDYLQQISPHNDYWNNRVISFVYYLTSDDWCEENGGNLMVKNELTNNIANISPIFNRLVAWKMDGNKSPLHWVNKLNVCDKARISIVGFWCQQ